jgi:hypothetical protein
MFNCRHLLVGIALSSLFFLTPSSETVAGDARNEIFGPPNSDVISGPDSYARLTGSDDPAAAQQGYVSRACGLDMDRDGIVGEASDCSVCDATLAGAPALVVAGSTDPDGDLTDEDIIYVDCSLGDGSDEAGCGLPGAPPCLTLQYALDNISDGPGDGVEDIICFIGVCNENVTITSGGVAGTHTVAASGSQEFAFNFADQPAMIIGWDYDADGIFPPTAGEQAALLDGNTGTALTGFAFDIDGRADYYEMAHFAVEDWGDISLGAINGAGVWVIGSGSDDGVSYFHAHDIEGQRIHQDRGADNQCQGDSGNSIVNMFSWKNAQYAAFTNMEFLNSGGWVLRGTGGDVIGEESHHMRFEDWTWTAHGMDNCPAPEPSRPGPTVAKVWKFVKQVEFVDSDWDANVSAWIPARSAYGIGIAQCAQSFHVVNNTFTDMFVGVTLQGSDTATGGECPAPGGRRVSDIHIVNNTFALNAPDDFHGSVGAAGIKLINGGDDPEETIGDVTITGNSITCSNDCEGAVVVADHSYSGALHADTLTLTNNYFDVPGMDGATAPAFGAVAITPRMGHDAIVMNGNSFAGFATNEEAIDLAGPPTTYTADNQCFDPTADYRWGGAAQADLDAWRTASGEGAGSTTSETCTDPT